MSKLQLNGSETVDSMHIPSSFMLKATAHVAVLVLMVFGTTDFLYAQNENALRPVFDESFFDWPIQTKINGRIIIDRGISDFEPVNQLLKRVVESKKVIAFSPAENTLTSQLESLADEDSFTVTQCDPGELENAIADAVTVYFAANSFSPKELTGSSDQIERLIQRGGNLIVDASIAEVLGLLQADGSPGMNLITDCHIDCSFDGTAASRNDLSKFASVPTRTVSIGIESDTMFVLSGRRIFSFGNGSTTLAIRGNKTLPPRYKKLSDQSTDQQSFADLTQWRRMAIDRDLPAFPPKNPKTPFVEKGSLYIVGGGGMPDGLMRQMIDEAGGIENAKCVYIPCSESEDVGQRQRTVAMWRRMGVKHATFIHTKDRNKANSDEAFLAPLKDATMLWFGGGRQWNFADSYYGTRAHRLMKEVLHRGGVIGGSSAGASIQGRFLARATPIGNSNILAPGYERGGLGFLSGVAIDQHFSQRRRQKDMTILVDKYPQLLGIGIDESTAIVVRKSRAEVVGRGRVFFYDRNKPVSDGKPDYTAVPAGGVYDLLTREVIESNE